MSEIEIDRNRRLGSSVFKGKFDGRDVAVKRVLLEVVNELEENALKQLDHCNVVKLIHCQSDQNFRYYAMELCVASLDKLFLPYFNKERYIGPMPRPVEVFLQLALGLQHIHSKNLIHRSIKPNDVLICVEGDKITIKWADFGLSRPVNERGTFTMSSGVIGTDIWLAPEMLKYWRQGGDVRGTVKSDIFALALVFGCLFLNGEHLYGSGSHDIQNNIIEGNPINMQRIDEELRNLYENSLFFKMLEDDPEKRMTSSQVVDQLMSIKEELAKKEGECGPISAPDVQLDGEEIIDDTNSPPPKKKKINSNALASDTMVEIVGKIEYDRDEILGKGFFGCVFKGMYDGVIPVAVKRIEIIRNPNYANEEETMRKLKHENIVKLFHCESDVNFRYFALELCDASLDQLFLESKDTKKYNGPMPPTIDVFLQLATGLEHIHFKELMHRDITPKNILIFKETCIKATIKLADFGLARTVSKKGTRIMTTGRNKTVNWLAPNTLRRLKKEEKSKENVNEDVFVLALIFGYLLLEGEHLYGSYKIGKEIEENIMENKPVNIKNIHDKLRNLNLLENDLLKKMLEDDSSKRISSADVVKQLEDVKKGFQ